MITKLNKNVICIKDIPSNLIEEAIFILRSDVNEQVLPKKKSKEIIITEAEEIIKEYSMKLQREKEEKRTMDLKESRRQKQVKTNIVFVLFATVFAFFIFYVIKRL